MASKGSLGWSGTRNPLANSPTVAKRGFGRSANDFGTDLNDTAAGDTKLLGSA
jgi:hypothetical protein